MDNYNINEEQVFSPPITNWMLALIAGVIFPLATQNFIAKVISDLSTIPMLIDGQIQETSGHDVGYAGITLIMLTIFYLLFITYQIRFIALLKTHSSVFAFVVTALSPFIVWLGLPFVLQAFNS